jgi:prevent-host-death family protein
MTRVNIGEFRDRASELIRRASGGETVIILKRDRPVAKIVPVDAPTMTSTGLVGALRGTAHVNGDIESPIVPPNAWFHRQP